MGRQAKPWLREEDGYYYVWHNGKQNKLDPDRGEAYRLFHALKADTETDTSRVAAVRLSVQKAFDHFLDYAETLAPRTYQHYQSVLACAKKSFGKLKVRDLKVYHVTNWLKTRTMNDTTKAKVIGVIKAALNYCVKQGYIDKNPIEHMEKPPESSRERIITEEEWELILGFVKGPFRELLFAMRESGMRPGEAAGLKPEHVNLEMGVIILKQHKTKRKTQRPRIIYMSPALKDLLTKKLEVTQLDQFIFRGREGNPWTRHSFYARFKYLRKKFPQLEGVVPYSARHTYATESLEKGIPEAAVAELLGHTSTQVLYRHYAHLSKKLNHMNDMAAKARDA